MSAGCLGMAYRRENIYRLSSEREFLLVASAKILSVLSMDCVDSGMKMSGGVTML